MKGERERKKEFLHVNLGRFSSFFTHRIESLYPQFLLIPLPCSPQEYLKNWKETLGMYSSTRCNYGALFLRVKCSSLWPYAATVTFMLDWHKPCFSIKHFLKPYKCGGFSNSACLPCQLMAPPFFLPLSIWLVNIDLL